MRSGMPMVHKHLSRFKALRKVSLIYCHYGLNFLPYQIREQSEDPPDININGENRHYHSSQLKAHIVQKMDRD